MKGYDPFSLTQNERSHCLLYAHFFSSISYPFQTNPRLLDSFIVVLRLAASNPASGYRLRVSSHTTTIEFIIEEFHTMGI